MKKTLIFGIIAVFVLAVSGLAEASTSAEKQVAINKGLAYLNSTAIVDPTQAHWNYFGTDYGNQAATGAALLSFTDQYYKPLSWNANYSSLVTKATAYLLGSAQSISLTPNWTGVSGTGLIWGGTAPGYAESTYTTGIVVSGLSRLVYNPYGGAPLVNPNTVISGTGNAAVDGLTYKQVLQKTIDTLAWGQSGPGTGNRYGGWRYVPNQMDSDMSTTQWPVIDFLFTKGLGVTVPNEANLKTALKAWLTADQIAGGGVEYQPGGGIVNATHAGGFLLSNFFAGGGGLGGNGKNESLTWLNGDWLNGPSGTWYGNEGHPYAMWAVYKALETLYGTSGATPITNLHPQTTPLDPGATWNWWEDYCQFLVTTQHAGGDWDGYSYWNGPLEAAWYINILNATTTITPTPIPGSLLLLGSALVGLGVLRKGLKK